ncbi:NUDIX hydrolase [Streptomyces sp. 35G-GA-8]|uniref:NUDIX hydrolase n=1 Tax=Streptomyces sp. 35G-GA-8 TaxID=2939434 RepID=UPI00201F180F|nr:NUDIX hydrolase [Streptomyces sp. 35G-GA-8]MCL7376993.1 NUDIX hydrolase [Streptomyces sp. 35G-GA-8]
MPHSDDYFRNPPPRRRGVLALIRDQDDRVLVVEKVYRKAQGSTRPWDLPGGGSRR